MTSQRQRYPLSIAEAEARLLYAKRDRAAHSADCPLWDYESTNGCEQCDRHDATVRKARQRWRTARGIES